MIRRPRRRLRTRLLVAMAAIAVGVLVVSGAVTITLARRTAVNAAQDELEAKAPEIASRLEQLSGALVERRANGRTGLGIGRLISDVLSISGGGLVTIRPDGTVTQGIVGLGGSRITSKDRAGLADSLQLPTGVAVEDLDGEALAAGQEQTGRRDGIVFVAQPLNPGRLGTPVLVLTQKIRAEETDRARGFFLIGSALAFGLAVAVAFILARRLTRPLAAMDVTARAIASGDLSARVDIGRHPDDELADLARTLNSMAAELERTYGLERAFMLSVSHDLRTPLTSIKGYAEAMTDGTLPVTEEQERAAQVIAAEARRLERLVVDLLDLARLDARQFSLASRPIDAVNVVRTTTDGFAPAASDLGLTVSVEAPDSLALDADPDRLAQIVANLVENALKYADHAIVVELQPYADGFVDLRVRDDGPGIAAADLPRVFDRLYVSRTVPGRSVGTGLGLAIVRELAAAMGGQVWAEPPGTSGATFVVRLPYQATEIILPEPLPARP